MNVRFIKSSEKREILAELEEIYGISELNYLLIEVGKQKIRGYSGNLSKDELYQLDNLVNVEIIGMYLMSKKDSEARLNFDASSLLRKQITKSITNINEQQLDEWLHGKDLEIPAKAGISVLQYEDNIVGIGKSNGIKIFNYVPKERKLKTKIKNL
jgi:NOL1/NOP2/fmu family ribosome biogenesis protein